MRMSEYCVACMLDKKLNACPEGAPPERIAEYRRRVRGIVENAGARSSPEVSGEISAVYRELFGPERDYTDVKRRFNALMLALEPELRAATDAAEDPLRRAVQFAMTGNFIDFAALGDVDEVELRRRLAAADGVEIDPDRLEALRRAARAARRLVYLTDNCGEIVADKLLLATLKRLNPGLRRTVIVRGAPVSNDATMEDARQVGLDAVAEAVLGSGSDLPGTVLSRLSPEARREIDAADVIVAKGQANYEGLCGCGRNVFYIFMCKCKLFTDRFGVPQFSGILTREPGVDGTICGNRGY